MKKGMKKIIGASVLGMAVLSVAPSTVNASTMWHANTPSEIGALNHDGTYTVKLGDTIWAIGVHFNIKPDVIEEVNHIQDPYLLQIGTILKLHLDKANDKASIEAITPAGHKYTKELKQDDKIVAHKQFGENVAKEVTPQEEQKAAAKANQQSSDKQKSTSQATEQQDISLKQLAMASYYDWFCQDGNTVSPKQSLYFVQDGANSYVVGQGTADNTVKITVNGDTITYDGGGNGTTDSQKGTLKKQDVINKYYATAEQKKIINDAIQHSSTYGVKPVQ